MSALGSFIAQYQRLVARFSKLYEDYVALRKETAVLHKETAVLRTENLALHEKVAEQQVEKDRLLTEMRELKKLPKRPDLKPSGMHKSVTKKVKNKGGKGGKKRRRGAKKYSPKAVVREVVVESIEVPSGAVRNGYQTYTVQGLLIQPEVVHYKCARWRTPDGKSVVAPLPDHVKGHFSAQVCRLALMLYCQGQSTFARVTLLLNELGITITKRTVMRLINAQDELLTEADEVLEAGVHGASWVNVDDTGARHRNNNGYSTVVGNDRFTSFATRPTKSRLSFLDILSGTEARLVVNGAAIEYMHMHKLPSATIGLIANHANFKFGSHHEWHRHLETLGITALQVTPDPVKIATEAVYWGALNEYRNMANTVVVSDDAGQFRVGTHALCWVHAERLVHKLLCPGEHLQQVRSDKQSQIWALYRELLEYKQSPTEADKVRLRQTFDRVFDGEKTDHTTMDLLLKRLHGKKDKLLQVLEHPDIPTHTNGAESDLRALVTRRKISAGTRSENGRVSRDAHLGLLKTCNKLDVSFWDYLGSRLRIPDAPDVPRLATLVSQLANPP